MKKLEAFVLGLVFAPAPVLFCFVGAWFTSFILYKQFGLSEKVVSTSALSGLAVGVIITAVVLRRWVRNAYKINNKALAALYIFYSIIAFGFGMGIPVFNYVLGMAAGVYIVRKMCYLRTDESECKRNIKKTSIFTAVIMLVVCCLMVLWGLAGEVSGKDFEVLFKSLFGLELTINTAGFVGIVFFGACAMILLQYWLTKLSAKITFKISR
jgi:hypothetical protein